MTFFLLSIICSLEGAFDYQIRHLNAILARGGNLKERIFKSSNAREIAQEGDVEASN